MKNLLKMMNFALKMADFCIENDGFCIENGFLLQFCGRDIMAVPDNLTLDKVRFI